MDFLRDIMVHDSTRWRQLDNKADKVSMKAWLTICVWLSTCVWLSNCVCLSTYLRLFTCLSISICVWLSFCVWSSFCMCSSTEKIVIQISLTHMQVCMVILTLWNRKWKWYILLLYNRFTFAWLKLNILVLTQDWYHFTMYTKLYNYKFIQMQWKLVFGVKCINVFCLCRKYWCSIKGNGPVCCVFLH